MNTFYSDCCTVDQIQNIHLSYIPRFIHRLPVTEERAAKVSRTKMSFMMPIPSVVSAGSAIFKNDIRPSWFFFCIPE
jgi:hypothetical protein